MVEPGLPLRHAPARPFRCQAEVEGRAFAELPHQLADDAVGGGAVDGNRTHVAEQPTQGRLVHRVLAEPADFQPERHLASDNDDDVEGGSVRGGEDHALLRVRDTALDAPPEGGHDEPAERAREGVAARRRERRDHGEAETPGHRREGASVADDVLPVSDARGRTHPAGMRRAGPRRTTCTDVATAVPCAPASHERHGPAAPRRLAADSSS